MARRSDDRDRRVVPPTNEGRELIDRLIPHQLRNEQELLEGLGTARQTELAETLAGLLVLVEGRLGGLRP
ncbi:hypothetical protein ACH427_31640 [Streptomyces sp. NPDC020379]|uniref:hypothetical protein n=1 Tax=Streptomyces sp. NPDC020379 TaxID=3365071 RepID=UPI0037A752B5